MSLQRIYNHFLGGGALAKAIDLYTISSVQTLLSVCLLRPGSLSFIPHEPFIIIILLLLYRVIISAHICPG